MKKFTTLEEDILKENAQVTEKFDTEFNIASEYLDKIKSNLNLFKTEFYGDPLGKKSKIWGYIGSLEHINELLNDVLQFTKEGGYRDEDAPRR